MTLANTADIYQLMKKAQENVAPALYEDSHFSRRKTTLGIADGVRAVVLVDNFSACGVRMFHVSIEAEEDGQAAFEFIDVSVACHPQGMFISTPAEGGFLWLARPPVWRQYDAQGRIVRQIEPPLDKTMLESTWRLTTDISHCHKLEFALAQFGPDAGRYKEELSKLGTVETMHVGRSNWFRYRGIQDLWEYFVNGAVFNTHNPHAGRRWPSQNAACAIYHHLDYLGRQTGKEIYGVFREFVAYATLLALSEDGRWLHGSWTNLMETHLLHQAAGVDILLSEYENTNRDIFLEKATTAADYLMSCNDRIEGDNVWFLHDTLEQDPDHAVLYYRGIGDSSQFGASPQNTLCLNTHVATLTVLDRIGRLTGEARYEQMFEAGLITLKLLLEEKPASVLYGLVYGLRDCLIRHAIKSAGPTGRKLQVRYESLLKNRVLPALRRRAPRFVMPNGFIERDIGFSNLSKFYHFLNLKVLLILYSQTREVWLRDILKTSVPYTVRTGLADYVAAYEDRAAVFLEVLLLYAALIDEQYARFLPSFLATMKHFEIPPQTDVYANPQVVNPSTTLRADHPNVCTLAPAVDSHFAALIINVADCQTKAVVVSKDSADTKVMQVVDASGSCFELGHPFMLPPHGYAKVVRINGQAKDC